jgi:dCMP deaminase
LISLSKEDKWLRACDALAALFSTCSRKQCFAVILAPNGRVCGVGYNGAPSGHVHCLDGGCPRAFSQSQHGQQYDNCIAQHAEQGALIWSDANMRMGGTLVVNAPPCMTCAKMIASSGISKVVHYADVDFSDWPRVEQFLRDCSLDVRSVNRLTLS